MPVYLVHGFRWPREGFTGIRVHGVINNLDELSAEYIQNSNSRRDLLHSLRKNFPDILKELDHSDPDVDAYVQPGFARSNSAGGKASSGGSGRRLEFIEQYNPDDVDGPHAVSQPYAYVGDKVVVIAASPGSDLNGTSKSNTRTPSTTRPATGHQPYALSVNVEEVIANGPGLTNKAWEALADLRDKIAEGEKIGWWVVYNGDPQRSFDESDVDDEYDEEEEMEDVEGGQVATDEGQTGPGTQRPLKPLGVAQQQRGHRPTESDNAPIPTSSLPESPQTQQQQYQRTSSQGLTALPIRPSPPAIPDSVPILGQAIPQGPLPTRSRPNTAPPQDSNLTKGKQKDGEKGVLAEDPARLKELNKSQGLRRKFFGRRT